MPRSRQDRGVVGYAITSVRFRVTTRAFAIGSTHVAAGDRSRVVPGGDLMRLSGRWLDSARPFYVLAAVLIGFGVLALLLELQSPSFVQWTGIKVHGDTYHGVTTYTYKGEQYSIENPAASAPDQGHTATSVWLPRSDPTNSDRAYIASSLTRWTDFVFLTMWLFGALVLVAAGIVRTRHKRQRRLEMVTESFGIGLDPEFTERLLARQRRPPPAAHPEDE